MKLVIVESPNKVHTIKKYLGSDYKVIASSGNIRDIATTGVGHLGIDIDDNFKPHYEIISTKKGIVTRLKKAVSEADEVYLATDPDREGEAIAWHLYETLDLKDKPNKRIEFNEITKYGIENGLAEPREINLKRVDSQETRRIMDRIIGFELSGLVKNKVAHSPAAGRVQSAVLRLLTDRENEIKNFVPTFSYTVGAKVDNKYQFQIVRKNNKTLKDLSKEEALDVLNGVGNKAKVRETLVDYQEIKPRLPLRTADLQQEANSIYRMGISTTMKAAQELFEGLTIQGRHVGLITYIRTDDTRLSPIFINQTKKYISENFGDEYVGKAIGQRGAAGQGAHEAIRPTDITLRPETIKDELSEAQYKVYKIIYYRALASIMKPAINRVETTVLSANEYELEYQTQENTFLGYMACDKMFKEKKTYKQFKHLDGEEVNLKDLDIEEHQTKAPSLYSEGQLVRKMQETGIGRPSTYVATIENLKRHRYIQNDRRRLIEVTAQGRATDQFLKQNFENSIAIDYTANMEKQLDDIAYNDADKLETIKKLYSDFTSEYNVAKYSAGVKVEQEPTGEMCPVCGKPLLYKTSARGKFIGCSGYPTCTFTRNIVAPNAKICPKCGKGHLVVRYAKNGKPFLGCERFPDCDYVEWFKNKYYKRTTKQVRCLFLLNCSIIKI